MRRRCVLSCTETTAVHLFSLLEKALGVQVAAMMIRTYFCQVFLEAVWYETQFNIVNKNMP